MYEPEARSGTLMLTLPSRGSPPRSMSVGTSSFWRVSSSSSFGATTLSVSQVIVKSSVPCPGSSSSLMTHVELFALSVNVVSPRTSSLPSSFRPFASIVQFPMASPSSVVLVLAVVIVIFLESGPVHVISYFFTSNGMPSGAISREDPFSSTILIDAVSAWLSQEGNARMVVAIAMRQMRIFFICFLLCRLS